MDAVRTLSQVDPTRLAAYGRSQGGGIALAVAGLEPDLPIVLSDVPFLCHYRRATSLVDTHPYVEIAGYLKIPPRPGRRRSSGRCPTSTA